MLRINLKLCPQVCLAGCTGPEEHRCLRVSPHLSYVDTWFGHSYLPRPLEGAVVWCPTTMAAPIGKGRICFWNRVGLCLWPDFHINNFQHIWLERVLWTTEGSYSTSVLRGIRNSGDQSRCFQGDLRTLTAGFVATETGSYFKRNTVFSQQTKHFLCLDLTFCDKRKITAFFKASSCKNIYYWPASATSSTLTDTPQTGVYGTNHCDANGRGGTNL